MTELTEQQNHLKNLSEQRSRLIDELNSKKELLLKITGAMEYLNTVGVTLESAESAEKPVEDSAPEVVAE
jgi:hypothetical protein